MNSFPQLSGSVNIVRIAVIHDSQWSYYSKVM